MDLRKKAILPFFILCLVVHGRAEAEPEPQAEPEALPDAQAPPQWANNPVISPYPGSGYSQGAPPPIMNPPQYNPYPGASRPPFADYPTNPVGPGGLPPNNRPPFDYPTNPVGPGGLPPNNRPPFDYPTNPVGPDPNSLPPNNNRPPFDYPTNPVGPDAINPENTCQMTDQCCGMAEENCCGMDDYPEDLIPPQPEPQPLPQPQQCSYYYEQVCTGNAKCGTKDTWQCFPITVPKCVEKNEVRMETFQSERCSRKDFTHCYKYKEERCNPTQIQESKVVNYETQTLKKVAEEIAGRTYNFTVYGQRCKPYEVTLNQTTYVQVPASPVKRNRTICNWVQEQGPAQKVKMMVWESVSRKMCYDIPVPVCNQSPCAQQGRCNQGTSPCSSTAKVPATVCPFSGQAPPSGSINRPDYAPNAGCQQVQQPACGQSPSQTCDQNFNQCCTQKQQKVCRNVLQRIPKEVEREIPGRVQWKQKCDLREETIPMPSRTEPRIVQKKMTMNKCEPYSEVRNQTIHDQRYEAVTEQRSGTVNVTIEKCNKQEVERERCVLIQGAKLQCQQHPIHKRIRITKHICSGEETRQKCFMVPVADCKPNQNCRMELKRRCRPGPTPCNNSPKCNACNQFRQNVGFGQCPDSQCNRYYPRPGNLMYNATQPSFNAGGMMLPSNQFQNNNFGFHEDRVDVLN